MVALEATAAFSPADSMTDHSVEVSGLSKRYGRTLALDDVSFHVPPGQMFALLGPNGAGKTTLIHILCTILSPDSGIAAIAGTDVVRHPRRARKNIGVVFQEPSLDDRLTAYENLNFHGLVYGVPANLRRERIEEMLAIVELTDWRDALVRSLSSGMKRRLEIARALIHDSRVLFLDEPTVGLDAQSREHIWAYLGRLRRERGITIIVTTHYIEEVENCDMVCIIDHGKILAGGTPALLKKEHGQEFVRVVPADEQVAQEILARYADGAVQNKKNEIMLKSSGNEFIESFLASFGSRLRQMAIERPSLESVFLTLTGRELRDKAADARERTFAFGRRGGEQTR